MITAIGVLDDRLKQLDIQYRDGDLPMDAVHLLALFRDIELVLLHLAVLEKRLEQRLN